MLISTSVGVSAKITDPASRSGVWEATENIAGVTVHFRLNVLLRTGPMKSDGTFELRYLSARLFSSAIPGTAGTTRSEKAPSLGLLPICDLEGRGELLGDQLTGTCRETDSWRRIEGTVDSKDATVILLLIGDSGNVSATFHRMPIDVRSSVDGDWQGTADLNPRHTILHFRTNFAGERIVTFDGWIFRLAGFPKVPFLERFWGLMSRFSVDDDTVKFQNEASIPYSEFVGKLSGDKQQITGHYTGRDFAENTFVRTK
jgi:hypothetical protein